jgi:hypothetical protein
VLLFMPLAAAMAVQIIDIQPPILGATTAETEVGLDVLSCDAMPKDRFTVEPQAEQTCVTWIRHGLDELTASDRYPGSLSRTLVLSSPHGQSKPKTVRINRDVTAHCTLSDGPGRTVEMLQIRREGTLCSDRPLVHDQTRVLKVREPRQGTDEFRLHFDPTAAIPGQGPAADVPVTFEVDDVGSVVSIDGTRLEPAAGEPATRNYPPGRYRVDLRDESNRVLWHRGTLIVVPGEAVHLTYGEAKEPTVDGTGAWVP